MNKTSTLFSQPRYIHVIFKTHLDVGFTNLARHVVKTYVDGFIPRAITMARELREKHDGQHRFIWTTGSWLIHHYLESVSPRRRRELETAILAGDIAWHALPFTTHTELMDAPLFRAGLGLSQELDLRFGKKTIAAKMTDVPGHTQAMIPLLAEAGVEMIHLGVNPTSTPPATPDCFRWRHPSSDTAITVIYEKYDYGGLTQIPRFSEALYFAHTGDNLGPCQPNEVESTFLKLQKQFPHATVQASTLDAFALALRKKKLGAKLPSITQEIGDTWIHGVGSDPKKVSHFRTLRTWRNGLNGIERTATPTESKALLQFDRRMLLVPEHTWGHDIKLCLGFEKNHDKRYARDAFQRARAEKPFSQLESSWQEQRSYLAHALDALRNTRFRSAAQAALRPCTPRRLSHSPTTLHTGVIRTPYFEFSLSPQTGSIDHLLELASGRRWADKRHPLGLLSYEIFSADDYEYLWHHYNRDHAKNRHWAVPDFLKPGIETAVTSHQAWTPRIRRSSIRHDRQNGNLLGIRILSDLAFDDPVASRLYGAPGQWQVETTISTIRPEIRFIVQWFEKPASRIPEATWFSIRPCLQSTKGCPETSILQLRKLGQWINPQDVVRNGNRTLHAVESCRYMESGQIPLVIENPDAPLLAPGRPSLVRFSNRLPRLSDGLHFNLHNNTWGTNFPLWYEDDARFEFRLKWHPVVHG